MKNLIITIFLLLLYVPLLWAQQTVTPSQINQPLTNSQSLTAQTGKNYIRSYTYRDGVDTASTKLYSANIDIQYFDGLGRPVENVSLKASPTGNDIVALQTYDVFGRTDKSYLPLSYTSTNGGSYVPEATVTSTMTTYLGNNFELFPSDASYGYSNPFYEASPLNRILKQGAPGYEWQTNQHPVQFDYQTNTTAIASWNYSGDTYSAISYAAGKLYVNLTTDEDGKQSRTYTDFQGKVVMKDAFDGTNWLQTRYCYDDFGQLRCVLQPMSTDPTSTEYCFYYKYDSRHRMTDKKVPGSDWVYMIYDKRDRLVLTSDGNSRTTNKWYYITYDNLNRPIQTGFFTTTASRETLTTYYTSNLTPYATGKIDEVMVYDKHNRSTPYSNCPFAANDLVLANDTAISNKGLMVCKQARTILGDDNVPINLNKASVYYYNKYGWMIQSVEETNLGVDRTSNKYNFTGQIIQTRVEHNFSGTTPYTVNIFYKYDHRGRVIQTDYQVMRNTTVLVPQTIVSSQVYNEAGQLKTKYLHSQSSNQAFTQKIDYKYNIRGWLTAINDPGLSSNENDRFGLKLYYNRNTDGSTAYWNGNIRSQKWASGGRLNQINTYSYDQVNRITSGNYPSGPSPSYSFLSTYVYDKNGNFTNLTRRGFSGSFIDQISYGYKGNNSNQIDYTTDASGDIAGVEDFPGTLTGANHYQYDANGNLTRDDYRALNISYNRFNLPRLMDFGTNQKVNYIYSGSGQKLYREVTNGTNPTIHSDYIGMFVHENTATTASSLKYIITPEGRIMNSGTDAVPAWSWEYNLTDHLGNVRVVIQPGTGNIANILEYNNYFPFGMKMTPYLCQSSTNNKYLYNGKEQQPDFGLNWYDYGARFYDPAIGRFHTIDPHAESYLDWTPYNYVANNPMNLIDPDGMDWYQDENKNTMWQKGSAAVEGYKNIGATYSQNIGQGVSIGYTQNEATSMTFTGIEKSNFVSQSTGTGCKIASDEMLTKEGVNSKGERINMVNADADGVATTANDNAPKGIKAVDKSLENGNPIEVGVDYKSKQVNNLKPKGDGMTDHFVAVSSKTETLNNGQVTSKTYNFFDPRKAEFGTSPRNTLNISNNKLVGAYRGERVIPYTVTTVRRSR